MRKGTQQGGGGKSGQLWHWLERMVREKVQEFIQEILEDEVTRFLGGRGKSQRRASVEGAPKGYRNGYGKPRTLTLASGTIEVRRPRLRDVVERFESRVLPLFARRTREAEELVVQLYLHGLAEGDFELALRGLLGEGAPLSKSTVRRLRERWVAEHAEWEGRSLADREVVYVWADGIYVKAGLEKDKAALPVVIGAMADGTKEVLAVVPGYRESAESWAAVLRDLRARGLGVPNLLVADGHLGIWAAARQVWPEAAEQRCWNHKMVNVLDRLPKREQKQAKGLLRKVAYAESRGDAEKAREAFGDRYAATHPKAVETLADDVFLPVAAFDVAGGAGDLGGEEAGPVEVEVGAEVVVEEGVDLGDEGVADVDVAEPFADDAAVLGFDECVVVAVSGPGLGEGGDVELVEQVGDEAVDVLASVVGVEGVDGEGEGGEKGFEACDEELPGDARYGSKVLELRDFVDDVDAVDALLPAPVAEVDGVDAEEAGLAAGRRLSAHPDSDGGGPGLAEGEAAGPVLAGLAEVVDVAVGDGGEPFEARVAVDVEHAPENHLGGGTGELSEGLVDVGQQGGVMGSVAALERAWPGASRGGHGCGPFYGAA